MTDTAEVNLHLGTGDIPLADLCAELHAKDAWIAMLSAPGFCRFGRWHGGYWVSEDGSAIDMSSVYAADILNASGGVSWCRSASATGGVVLSMSEGGMTLESALNLTTETCEAISFDDILLIRGQPKDLSGTAPPWCHAGNAQVGVFAVPTAFPGETRQVGLVRRSYFTAGPDGNLLYRAARFTGFISVNEPEPQAQEQRNG